ncbi:MAG: phosphoribosylanthranilate isomerase [Lachnospiraceae bacterium]|nr:phosphoribosylanthranilate isomerase [Lachnospiraceae bacterium]
MTENTDAEAKGLQQLKTKEKPLIKICGLSRSCDIDFVNMYQPDLIGFVFAKSKRQVTIEQAKQLRQKLAPSIKAVGVFVNEDPEIIASIVQENVIDLVQLHGQEDSAYVERLRNLLQRNAAEKEDGVGCQLIQAFCVKTKEDVKRACQSSADFILLDHGSGGTGKAFDWECLKAADRPFFLAGGLNPENIHRAALTGAYGLDVSSGVETEGFKDPGKIKRLLDLV